MTSAHDVIEMLPDDVLAEVIEGEVIVPDLACWLERLIDGDIWEFPAAAQVNWSIWTDG